MAPYNFKQFLQLVCFGLILLKEMANACNMTAVNECTEILSRSSDASVITDGISAIPTVDQLQKLCGALGEFKACYQPKAAECRRDVVFSMTFGTIENTIEYLCVEGYQDILQYATCWNQTEVIEESTKCHIKQNQMISSLHSQQKAGNLNSTAMRGYWCNILDNTTACMREGVVSRCGNEAGCIMHTMMSRALKGLSSLMKCPAPVSCQLHSDGTEHTHGDTHPDHGNVDNTASDRHSDGTPHTHGDTHTDHTVDSHADAEVNANDPTNKENSAVYNSLSAILSISVVYLSISQISS
ncbi:uncharacterized protein LOC123546845 [Mercenaria mercenaria]|uniref:uncharacterized protein LOC123546845 n=1 Tax=Mercenaria mercenaria TaxID=6596 RepID=UPI00234FAB26|nr:uncharacterized protein LOC123546845 [Mercenaria mercenaria]